MISKMALSNQSQFPRFFSPRKMTYRNLANSGFRQAGIGQAPVSHLPRFVDAVRWLTGACRFRLVVSRNRPDYGKSSSGDWKIAESDFGWTKSSQKSLSRTNQMQKTTKKCTNTKIGTQTSHSFFGSSFFMGICLSRQQRIWNQHKHLRFLIPILIFFNNSTFWNLKMQMRKNCTFSNILQKVKSYFFANIYHSPCDSH